MSLREAKTRLRAALKTKLKQLTPQAVAGQSQAVLSQLVRHHEFHSARKIAVYMNMPHLEIDTHGIITSCFDANKQVYLPRCTQGTAGGRKNHHMTMLNVSRRQVAALVPQGKYGLLEPTSGRDILDEGGLDVVIVPGVAFTRDGARLGHGAGYYDEFLLVYRQRYGTSPYLIGVALQDQVVDTLPVEQHDWTLDSVIVGE